MLLESFAENLEIAREFARHRLGTIEPLQLGHGMSTSFSVGVRNAIHGKPISHGGRPVSCEVDLVHVGKIIRTKDVVSFNPCAELQNDATLSVLRLGQFLKDWLGSDKSNFLGVCTWATVFQQPDLMPEIPWLPCFGILEKLGTDMLMRLRKKDRMLVRVPFEKCEEAFCLYIHDAIVSGHGIEIEWLGIINADCSLKVGDEFAKTLGILHGDPISHSYLADFIVSEL